MREMDPQHSAPMSSPLEVAMFLMTSIGTSKRGLHHTMLSMDGAGSAL